MGKPLQMKLLLIVVVCTLFTKNFAQSPVTTQEKITDSLAQILIRDLNNQETDSMYALMSENFKSSHPYGTFKGIATQVSALTPFYNVRYKESNGGINRYRVESKEGPILIQVGLDSINKIETFRLDYYSDDALLPDKYKRQEAMITMRDGIKLHTVIFTPVDQSGPLPFLLERTP